MTTLQSLQSVRAELTRRLQPTNKIDYGENKSEQDLSFRYFICRAFIAQYRWVTQPGVSFRKKEKDSLPIKEWEECYI